MKIYPKRGQVYRHANGGFYQVLAIAEPKCEVTGEEQGCKVVVYATLDGALTFTRSWANFVGLKDGKQRFRLVAADPVRLVRQLEELGAQLTVDAERSGDDNDRRDDIMEQVLALKGACELLGAFGIK